MNQEIKWEKDVPKTEEMGAFSQYLDAHVARIAPGRCHLKLKVADRHMNSLGLAHGGAVASLLDHAMGLAASYQGPGAARRSCLTVSLNVQYLKPAFKGEAEVKAMVIGGGHRLFFVEAELVDGAGQTIARAQSTFKQTADRTNA